MNVTETDLKRCIAKYGPPEIKKRLLNDEHYFGCLYTTMLWANHKWDSTRGIKKSTYIIKSLKNRMGRIHKEIHRNYKRTEQMGNKDLSYLLDTKTKYQKPSNIDLSVLPHNERHVIEERYYQNRTLQAIGDDLGYTREYIRQIETKALRKLYEQVS